MRTGGMILGIVGGIVGLVSAFVALTIGGFGGAFGAPEAGAVVGQSVIAMLASVTGIVGGALAQSRPGLAGALMLIGAVVGTISIPVLYLPAGLVLLIGGVLAILGRRPAAPPAT